MIEVSWTDVELLMWTALINKSIHISKKNLKYQNNDTINNCGAVEHFLVLRAVSLI